MYGFRIEAVGSTEDENLVMPKSEAVREILKRLLSIYGSGPECDLSPKGEFSYRARRKSRDRIFRIRDFEGRNTRTFKGIEDDGGPGRGGIDLLGKYTLSDSTVTIYVDSCRKVVGRRYPGVDSLEGLIEVVLIHELAHLITHRVDELVYKNESDDSVHLWEYIAQCATYAYLSTHCEKDLEVFRQLSSRQPFIYQTWEGLKALASVHPEKLIVVVKAVLDTVTLIPKRGEIHDMVGYDMP
jgi:hypothetical protein